MRDLSRDSTQLIVRGFVQTFLDNVMIESVQDVTRRWHRPKRRLAQPLITKDRPWEHSLYFTYSNHCVIRDPESGLFKCWYEDLEGPPKAVGQHFGCFSRQLYAESEDGLRWRKPELGLYELDGHRTNVVLGDADYGQVHSANVVLDPHPPTPEERFRAVYTHLWGSSGHRIECAHSPDGIHWSVYGELPSFGACGARLGDVSTLFYDQDSREFVQNTRHCRMGAGICNPRNPRVTSFGRPNEPHNFSSYGQRRIFQCRSHDFIHWSEPILVAATDDEEDNLDESFYGMPQFKVGSVYLATVGVLHAVDNEMDVQLLMSRDGIRWSRTAKRQPFLAPRGEGYWDAHMVSMVSAPIEVGGELWFYHGGTNYHHDWWLTGPREHLDHPEARHPEGSRYCLGLATLRKEGFASLFANRLREGIVVTRPLESSGTKLVINGKCGAGGSIRVEVADRYDEVVSPCSKANCDPFVGDAVEHTVTWNHDPAIPLDGHQGTASVRKLRFFLRNAEIYSFRFVESENG